MANVDHAVGESSLVQQLEVEPCAAGSAGNHPVVARILTAPTVIVSPQEGGRPPRRTRLGPSNGAGQLGMEAVLVGPVNSPTSALESHQGAT